MSRFISYLILTISSFTFLLADVFMTELTDPQNSSDAGRYVELYNNGSEDIDLSTGWALQRWTNGNADPQSPKYLVGTIAAGGFYIICNNADKFATTYGLTCDDDIGTGGPADSNGDDNVALLDASGDIVDMFGVAGEDGSGTGHEFEDGRAERAEGNSSASAIWDEAGWNIDNDSGGGDGNQYAPEGFDPGEWIGAGVVADDGGDDSGACDDEDEDGICDDVDDCVGEYDDCGVCNGENADVDCNGSCFGGAIVDECGVCGGDNACLVAVTFTVNMALAGGESVGVYGINGDWSTGVSMDSNNDGTWSTTINLVGDSFHLFKYKNENGWEDVDGLECSWFDDPDGDGFGYWDRYLNLSDYAGEDTVDLASVCFGECGDCAVEVPGCTDPLADNYNADANVDDDSCEYSFADPENLFFSEYAEGSSNNKYLEIYNATDGDVDLSGYSLSSCSNGCNDGVSWDYPDNVTFEAGTTVAAGDVYVVCHGSSDDIILSECDQTFTYLSNGDDVFALTQIGSGAVLDIIGFVGDDPGSGWEVAGVNNATKDHTLVRKENITMGNVDWASSAGTTTEDSEWVVLDQNTWTFIGFHPHSFASLCDDSAACNFGEEGDCTYAEEGYDCDGNLYINITFNVNMAEQVVDTEGYGLDLYLDDPYGYHDMLDDDGDGVWSVTLTLLANTSYEYKFKNGDEWEVNFNDLGCGAGESSTYGNRIFTSGDSDMEVGPFCFNSCSDCVVPCTVGDVNGDQDVNVLDVVEVVTHIINGDGSMLDCSDANGDGMLNILDIVVIVDLILSASERSADASSAILEKGANGLNFNANGFIGGIQMTLSHDSDFRLDLTNKAMVADYSTDGTSTTLIVVVPESEEVFTSNGDYTIEEVIVANSEGEVSDIEISNVAGGFVLGSAYPNPFNPTTTVELSVAEAGFVSVSVYNVMGQLVQTLAEGQMEANVYSLTWNASDVPSGMYFVRAEVAGFSSTQKVMLMK